MQLLILFLVITSVLSYTAVKYILEPLQIKNKKLANNDYNQYTLEPLQIKNKKVLKDEYTLEPLQIKNKKVSKKEYALEPLQMKYKKLLKNKYPIVICTGPAGSGKTMIACMEAIYLLKEEKIKKIVITRPIVAVEEDLGFLPGTLEEKTHPYMIPIYDYFMEHYTKDQINILIKTGKLEIAPLAFMRGRTFKDCYILADEMQNSSKNQMKMLLTRIGENCKLIITGDLQQNDLEEENGLKGFIELLEKKYPTTDNQQENGFANIKLDFSCIKRHEIIQKVLNIYE